MTQEMVMVEKYRILEKEKGKYYNSARTKARMEAYIREASAERRAYSKAHNATKLAEAGEKLWGATNYLLELKANRSISTTKEAKAALAELKDKELSKVYDEAFLLHTFFYGWTEDMDKIVDTFDSALEGLETLNKETG